MFVVTFATQEAMLFRNVKTHDVVVSAEDKVEQCTYAAVITRVEEELDDELTNEWKVIEVHLQKILYVLIIDHILSRWRDVQLGNTYKLQLSHSSLHLHIVH